MSEQTWTLSGGYSSDGNWPGTPSTLMVLVDSGPKLKVGEKVEVVPAEQFRGAVDALDRVAKWARDGEHPDKIAWEAERAARVARGVR